jgi:uncharacterized protein (TIGR02145 family)
MKASLFGFGMVISHSPKNSSFRDGLHTNISARDVPSDADWDTLQNYLIAKGYNGDGSKAGITIAEAMAAKTDWISTFTGMWGDPPVVAPVGTPGNDFSKNNAIGFSALPGGYRHYTGDFYIQSKFGVWWSGSAGNAEKAGCYSIVYDHYRPERRYDSKPKHCGYSVRLVKDN